MKRITSRRLVKAGGIVLLLLLVWYHTLWLRAVPALFASGAPHSLFMAGVLALCFFLALVARQRYVPKLSLSRKEVELRLREGESDEATDKAVPLSSRPLAKSVDAALEFVRRGGPWWRLGRYSAYRLPWYVVMGSRSDEEGDWLDAAPLRVAHHRVVAGIQAASAPYTWRLTDAAVIVDTRSGSADDDVFWNALLKRLRRVRRRCPVNGVIAVIHAHDLMQGDTLALRRDAQALRERLDMMQRRFGRSFPVYLVVAHAQILPGFSVLFEDLDVERRNQFWGVVFPWRTPNPWDHALSWSSLFRERFPSLVQRLEACLIDRLAGMEDVSRSAEAYALPHHLSRWQPVLAQYLDDAFGYSPYAPDVMLRAIGLTAVQARLAKDGQERNAEGYFIGDFLRRGVFRESSLAGERTGSIRKRRVYHSLAFIALSGLVIGMSAGAWASYQRNQALLAQANALNTTLAKKTVQGIRLDDPWSVLPLLDAMRETLPAKDEAVPLLYRFGLYQGDRIATAIQSSYQSSLHRTVLPIVAERLRTAMQEDGITPAARFQLLRLYLMLGTPSHCDPAAVMAWLRDDVPNWPGQPLQRQHFLAHAQALFNVSTFKADMPLDQALVAQTRATLSSYPLASRLFHMVNTSLAASNLQPLSVSDMGGINTALVLYRKRGAPMSEGVQGAYTLAGYARYLELRRGLLKDAERDDWVMGHSLFPRDAAERSAVLQQVDLQYLDSYAHAWEALLSDIAVNPSLLTGEEGSAMLRLLAGPDSPLRALLLAASEQTALDTAANLKAASVPPQRTLLDRLHHLFDGNFTFFRHAGVDEPAVDVRPLSEHFAALHRLMAPDAQGVPSPFGKIQQQLEEIAVFLDAAKTARARGLPPPANDALAMLDQMASGLPPPLPSMLATLSGGANAMNAEDKHVQWNRLWQAQVAPFCHAAIRGRYPFDRSSATDATLKDFTQLFAPEGLLDAFFHDHLLPDVDTTSHPWRWKNDVAPADVSAQTLAMFERAAAIRDAFFERENKTINVSFTLVPRAMDAGLTRFVLTLDGQVLDYAHDPRRPVAFAWPKADGAQAARIDYEPADQQRHGMRMIQGPWALFRLLDQAVVQQQRADRYTVTFHLGKRQAALELQADSVVNPFGLASLRGFDCRDTL
jgi:type VI secretion system protein ImpL